MVKTKGPSLSPEASGKLADALIFSHAPNAAYVKTHRSPKNPRSGGQVSTRAAMKFLSQEWSGLLAIYKASWQARADKTQLYPYHAYISENQRRWHSFLGLTQMDNYTGLSSQPTAPLLSVDPYYKMARLHTRAVGSGGAWGYFAFRSTSTGFTPAIDNMIGVFDRQGYHSYYFDTPLVSGTYYYRVQAFRIYGRQSAVSTEASVVIA